MTSSHAKAALKKFASKEKAKILQGFFKTGKGEYGEGDIFIGVKVPETRSVAKQYLAISLKEVLKLIKSPIHEERLLALVILAEKFKRAASENDKKNIFNAYIKNTKFINNWDLVDLSAPCIVGPYLENKDRGLLYEFAKSTDLWKRRIAIISTFHFIRDHEFDDTLKISEIFLNDKEDLIHKAVGWMLREVGKRDLKTEEAFLRKHYKKMPRTMLRYAIERFEESKRKTFLCKKKGILIEKFVGDYSGAVH
jgi:3-methyladenine DNA glycosylase AlkD